MIGISIPSVNKFNCVAGASPQFDIINTAPANLTTALLKYRIDGGAWADYPWAGNLAPGATETITLSGKTMNTSAFTKVEIMAVGSNNGYATNLIGVSTILTKSLLSAPTAIPYSYGFQDIALQVTNWTYINPSKYGWMISTSAGSGSTRSAECKFWDVQEWYIPMLATPKIDLTAATGSTSLKFDHAYTYYQQSNSIYFDSLRIEVSANCGETWTTVFHDGYETLATAPPQSSSYTPASDQWQSHDINISAYNGAEILVRFMGESGMGNNLYIDNVNVAQTTGVGELTLNTFELTPNPTRDHAHVRFSLAQPESIRLLVYNSIGALVQAQEFGELGTGAHNQKLDAAGLHSGSYRVVLQGRERIAQRLWVVVK